MHPMPLKALIFTLLLSLFVLSGCRPDAQPATPSDLPSGELRIFHAGSLAVPFKAMADSFNRIYPQVKILSEAAGSVACARKITDLKRPADILASADYKVINQLLIPDYATWNIKFAANEMAIVYTPHSKYAHEINAQNWSEILGRKEVKIGRSDPHSDPCGYRSVLCLQLSEKVLNQPGLAKQLLAKDQEYIRPKETDLLAMLESHSLDYIFLYRSVAVQHGLPFLLLPDSINLKNAALADFYQLASVEINGKKPGEKIIQKGAPMVYGISIPKSAPNPALATLFLEFALGPRGQAIMEQNGQPSVVPAPSNTYQQIPASLQTFALPPEK